MATQIGTDLEIGAETITGSYIVTSRRRGKNFTFTDVNDENGALKSRLIKQIHPTLGLDLVEIEGALGETDFPKGAMATHTDYVLWFVNDAEETESEDATRLRVELENLGIT